MVRPSPADIHVVLIMHPNVQASVCSDTLYALLPLVFVSNHPSDILLGTTHSLAFRRSHRRSLSLDSVYLVSSLRSWDTLPWHLPLLEPWLGLLLQTSRPGSSSSAEVGRRKATGQLHQWTWMPYIASCGHFKVSCYYLRRLMCNYILTVRSCVNLSSRGPECRALPLYRPFVCRSAVEKIEADDAHTALVQEILHMQSNTD
jgi:hypothetical protein